jgi:hypothetical protein
VASLLDTQDAGVDVFAGQDTGNPPVPNPDDIADGAPGTFFGAIQSAVSQLGSQTAAQVAQATPDALAHDERALFRPLRG